MLGAVAEAGAVSAASYTLDRPALLVMGNEGYGLRTTVRRLCDTILQVRWVHGGDGVEGGRELGMWVLRRAYELAEQREHCCRRLMLALAAARWLRCLLATASTMWLTA